MAFPGFTAADFKVFEIEGFAPRMEAIRRRLRPKLEAAGRDLLPDVTRIGGAQAFSHVARHARRTVNPPDDTWVAFAADRRGYKKHCHFRIAVSGGAIRFLFEAGPEHAGKRRWVAAWKRDAPKVVPVLRRARGLAWFRNEHDDAPAAVLSDLPGDAVGRLGEELLRKRDGQLVLGRAVPAEEALRWKPGDCARVARETFHLLAPLYRLR
ncbi:MAG: hypothetical protein A2X52_05585 [Candidatus Rokubacteria bacterium GWC2_70_16]|nr:MAG: hypothetical protein A2X52_05585 [Candidatus Rokubacteria bacterium GWC2_70_16]